MSCECFVEQKIIMRGTWLSFISILNQAGGQIRRDLDQTTTKEEFVNSPILSLTTQNDLGVLIPPLNLTFGHVNIVR